jgi:hypothetical protein
MLALRPAWYAALLLSLTGCLSKILLTGKTGERPDIQLVAETSLFYADTISGLPQKGVLSEMHNGKQLFTASVKNGKLNGPWQSWYANGITCDSGYIINNLPDGIWKYRGSKGGLLAIREYKAEKYQRIKDEMLRYHPQRNFYYLARLYQQNKQAALHYISAAHSFSIKETAMKSRLATLKQIVQANIEEGAGYMPVFYNCVHEGLYMNFFSNGAVRDSGYYKDGLRTGKWVHYESPGGKSLQGRYEHGNRIKDWKIYNKDQRLTEVLHYDNKGIVQWQKKIKG